MEKRIFYVLSLFLFACMQIVNAQQNAVDKINWKDYSTDLAEALTTDETNPTMVLLYNVKTGLFLSNGGDYSMQGVLSNIGNRFYITKQENIPDYATKSDESDKTYTTGYVIHSNTKNLAEKDLGNCMSIHFGDDIPDNNSFPFTITEGKGLFMDRRAEFDSKKSSNSMPNWRFTPVETKVYYISNIDVVGDAGGVVTVNKENDVDNTLVAYGTGTDTDVSLYCVSLYCDEKGNLRYSSAEGKKDEWYIITEKNYRDVITNLLPYSYVDVSGLVHDGGFNRFNTFAKDWVALKEDGTQVGIDEADNLGYYLNNYPNKNYVDNFAYDTYSEILDEKITRNNVSELLAYRSHIIGAGRLERKLYQRYNIKEQYISGYDENGNMLYDDTPKKYIPIYTFLGADGDYNLVVNNGFLTAVPTTPITSQLYVSGANYSLKKSGLVEGDEQWELPVAVSQVSDGIYRMTLTTGFNLNATNINFKFFKYNDPNDWGDFTKTIDSQTNTDGITLKEGLAKDLLDFTGEGNFKLKDGLSFDDKTTYVFTVTDIDKANNKYTLDIQKQKVDGNLTADGTTATVLKKDFVYTINVNQPEGRTLEADPDFFLANGDGTYRFMAVDGEYTITVVDNKFNNSGISYLKAIPTNETGHLYVCGENIKYCNWNAGDGPKNISKVSDGVYRLTMTTGKDFDAYYLNIKFYKNTSWEATNVTLKEGLATDVLSIAANGNIQIQKNKNFERNTTYVFTLTPNGTADGYDLDIQKSLESEFASVDNTTATALVKDHQYKIKKNTENIELDPEFFELAYFVEDTEIVDKTRNNWNNTQPWLFWKDYGKYFSAGIYSNGSYKQTVKDAPEGTYYVRCTAVNTGTNEDFGKFTVNGQTISILPLQEEHKQRYEDIKKEVIAAAKERLWLTDDYYYQRLDAIVAAKFLEEFKDQYTLEITVKVPKDKGTIDIEFANRNTDAASALANPVFADNFQIFYGNQEYVAYISANNATSDNVDKFAYNKPVELYVRRAFQKGAWNSIVLPFDITEANVVAAFGEGAKLSMLEGVNPDRPTQIKFDYVNVLPAGECGLVLVPSAAKEINFADYDTESIKDGKLRLTVLAEPITSNTQTSEIPSLRGEKYVSRPLYYFGYVSRPDNGDDTGNGFVDFTIQDGNVSGNVVTKDYTTDAGTLKYTGYYYKQNAKWEAGSYIVDGGNMYYLTEEWGVKYATMWSLKDPNSTEAKTFEINGVADYTVTEISGIAMDTNKVNDGKIYNINGQYVGTTADNLPKGLYIVNGKKFVVK